MNDTTHTEQSIQRTIPATQTSTRYPAEGNMPRKKIIKQEETGYSHYKTYLTKGIEMIDSLSQRHRKVMQTRMDFRYPQEMETDGSNKDFSKALQGLSKELNKDGYDPQYLGRREQNDQPHQRYHLNLLTNAKKHENRYGIIKKAERHWGNALGLSQEDVRNMGLVDYCDKDHPNGYMLTRGSGDYTETRDHMIRQMSYLTKYVPKDTTPTATRKFFVSQFKKDGALHK